MVHDFAHNSDGRSGVGGSPNYFVYKIHATTGQLSLHGRIKYDGGAEDTSDAFEFYNEYFVIVYTISSTYFASPLVPFVSVFRLADLVLLSSHQMGFRMPWQGYIINTVLTDLYVIPHLYRVGHNLYCYGLTKNFYSAESSTRFPFVHLINMENYASEGKPRLGGGAGNAA